MGRPLPLTPLPGHLKKLTLFAASLTIPDPVPVDQRRDLGGAAEGRQVETGHYQSLGMDRISNQPIFLE